MSINWGDGPAWISSVSGLGALASAIVATTISWRTWCAEQERDREREEEARRSQANLVAAVPTSREITVPVALPPDDLIGEHRRLLPAVAVINRSNLPIYDAEVCEPDGSDIGHVAPGTTSEPVTIPYTALKEPESGIGRGSHAHAILHEGYSFTFDRTLDPDDLSILGGPDPEDTRLVLDEWARHGRPAIAFTDAAGRRWRRDSHGLLTQLTPHPE